MRQEEQCQTSIHLCSPASLARLKRVPATSIDSDVTPIANHADEQANATSLPPSQRPGSAQAAHDEISKRHRKSLHSRYVDVKTRLIALWHQSLRHEKTRDGLYSNSNNGERKKVGYAIESRD